MTDFSTLLTFFAAAVAISILPGPAVSAVLSAGLTGGIRSAFATEIGLQIGRFTMIALVALALEVVRGVIVSAFDIIKYAGAIYLAWLGLRFILFAQKPVDIARRERTFGRSVMSGFLVTWTNPKAFLFFGAFLPQFVNPAFPAWPQVLFFGLLEMAVAAVTDMGYALLAVFARQQAGETYAVWLGRAAGAVLIAAAIWLALQH